MDLPTQESIKAISKPVILDEESHTIQYRIITNDGDVESLKLLANAKTLFQRQLPKMPGEYIARLVFDPYYYQLTSGIILE